MSAPSNGNGTARWQLWVSVAVLVLAVGGAIVQFGMLTADIRSLKTSNDDLRRRLESAESRIVANKSEVEVLNAKLAEVETQFRGEAMARNVIHADDMRLHALLFEKTFHARYPTDNAYYPSIAR